MNTNNHKFASKDLNLVKKNLMSNIPSINNNLLYNDLKNTNLKESLENFNHLYEKIFFLLNEKSHFKLSKINFLLNKCYDFLKTVEHQIESEKGMLDCYLKRIVNEKKNEIIQELNYQSNKTLKIANKLSVNFNDLSNDIVKNIKFVLKELDIKITDFISNAFNTNEFDELIESFDKKKTAIEKEMRDRRAYIYNYNPIEKTYINNNLHTHKEGLSNIIVDNSLIFNNSKNSSSDLKILSKKVNLN